jgi:hypothetical protein
MPGGICSGEVVCIVTSEQLFEGMDSTNDEGVFAQVISLLEFGGSGWLSDGVVVTELIVEGGSLKEGRGVEDSSFTARRIGPRS